MQIGRDMRRTAALDKDENALRSKRNLVSRGVRLTRYDAEALIYQTAAKSRIYKILAKKAIISNAIK